MATSASPSPQGEGKDLLFQTLARLGIPVTTGPYMDRPQRNGMLGVFCKNLFLKDRKGQFYLVVIQEDKVLDLKWLKNELKAARNFSFASGDELSAMLGVIPGGVTPFGLIFDEGKKIKVVIDKMLVNCEERLNFHPLDSKETALIKYDQLDKFLKCLGYETTVIEF